MSDGSSLAVQPIHLFHGENVSHLHYVNLHHEFRNHTSPLSSIISSPAVLAQVEANYILRNAILVNPHLARAVANNPDLLNALSKSPSLLSLVTSNPDVLSIIKNNLAFLREISRHPGLSVNSILDSLSKKNTLPTTDRIDLKAIKTNNIPHPLDVSEIVAHRVPLRSHMIPVGVGYLETLKQQASQVLQTKIIQENIRLPRTLIPIIKIRAYQNARFFALNPSLLAILGGIAFAATRTKIAPLTGSLTDEGIELETQSESQPDAIQESDQIAGVGEIGEIHSISEATVLNLRL